MKSDKKRVNRQIFQPNVSTDKSSKFFHVICIIGCRNDAFVVVVDDVVVVDVVVAVVGVAVVGILDTLNDNGVFVFVCWFVALVDPNSLLHVTAA